MPRAKPPVLPPGPLDAGLPAPLREVVARVAAVAEAGRLPVVVLDVDSSLLDTSARHLWILREWALRRMEPELRALAREVSLADMGWSLEQVLEGRGVEVAPLKRELRRFWASRFFSSEGARRDIPYDGAVAFVRALWEAGALVVYLTARPAEQMALGTLEVLQSWGFPVLCGRAMLHLKPSSSQEDHAFKAEALELVRELRGEVVATLENEPGNANLFLEAFPGATHLLADTVHKPTAPEPRPELVRFAWPGDLRP